MSSVQMVRRSGCLSRCQGCQDLKVLGFKGDKGNKGNKGSQGNQGNKGNKVKRSSQGQGVLKNSSQIELDS